MALRHLAHDHADLNARVVRIAEQLRKSKAAQDDLAASLNELREHLFLHFAREEEGLFPFVADAVPDLADRVNAMATAHDTICGALARMCYLAARKTSSRSMMPVFKRFEATYAEHAKVEREVLRELEKRLDAAQRRQLSELVAGL